MEDMKVLNISTTELNTLKEVLQFAKEPSQPWYFNKDKQLIFDELNSKILNLLNNEHNILKRADDIVNVRREEKERMYGNFSKSIEEVAEAASIMLGKTIDAKDVFFIMINLKLCREGKNHREDNLLDACAYIGAYNNYIVELENRSKPQKSDSIQGELNFNG